jgi:hypothetical protein
MQLTLLGAKFGAMYDHLVSPSSRTPDPNDWPSTWPPALLEEAQLLTRRILTQFREEVVRDGRTFMVMYVPHGNEEVRGRLGPGQSWFPWLSETCAELGIELLDPRERLREEDRAGRPTYDDHWSPAGHAVIASVMTERLAAGRAAVR